MDYRDIKIEGGIVTMPLDNFNKIETELDFWMKDAEVYTKLHNESLDKIDTLNEKLSNLDKHWRWQKGKLERQAELIEAFECVAEHGYCYVVYSSTDCDNRTAEGICKTTNPSKFIEDLYNNAEGNTSYELITKDLENYEEYRISYGGWN